MITREIPFLWPSWLAKLISGSDQCEWKFWIKSHYKFDEKSSEFSLTTWAIKHNQLVKARRNAMEKLGYEIFTEGQNSFKFEGDGFVVSGKPDLIAVNCEENVAIIEDIKSGKPRPEHAVQDSDLDLYGTVVYKDGIKDIDITSDMIDEELKAAMWDTVRLVIGSEENCHRVPSHYECQFCEVPKEECPHKVN